MFKVDVNEKRKWRRSDVFIINFEIVDFEQVNISWEGPTFYNRNGLQTWTSKIKRN